jgi:dTMP kinase
VSRGVFITLEGPDGAGKSTQGRLLAEALREAGREVVLTREPGGSAGAEAIRALLVEGEPGRWSAMTELLLFNAARRDHVERTIEPALARGAVVICDRFVDSTRAYQGAGRDTVVTRDTVDLLHRLAIGHDPDLTLILDLDTAMAGERGAARASGEDRFERFGAAFQQRLRTAFAEIAAADPGRCVVIDGSGTPETVHARLRAAVAERLGL